MALVPLLSREGAPAGFTPLDINTKTGVRRFFKDLGDGKVRIVSVQPVQEILDENQRQQFNAKGTLGNDANYGAAGVLAARIPTHLYDSWRYDAQGNRLDSEDFHKKVQGYLNSNEYQKLRVAEYNL